MYRRDVAWISTNGGTTTICGAADAEDFLRLICVGVHASRRNRPVELKLRSECYFGTGQPHLENLGGRIVVEIKIRVDGTGNGH